MLEGMPSSVSTMASSRGWRSAKSLLVMADFAPDLLAEVRQSGSAAESNLFASYQIAQKHLFKLNKLYFFQARSLKLYYPECGFR